jgi:serine O-acetyltransferase
MSSQPATRNTTMDPLWQTIRDETWREAEREPILASFLHATILNHDTLEAALSFHPRISSTAQLHRHYWFAK